jgi:Protein of unknown function (DUF3455)
MNLRLPRVALAVLVAAIAALSLGSAAASAGPAGDSDLPERLQIGDGQKPYLLAHATGVQIYECVATAAGPKWQLVAPRADLYGENGQLVATHFAGPTWQGKDGSLVKARRVDGLTIDPTAIPWLKLQATSTAVGPEGDRLAHTTYIQRINTVGGLEPAAAECTAESLGSRREIPYTADYRFWKEQGA